MNTRSRLPEQGWRAVGRHGGLLPLTVVPSHFSLVFVKPVRIPRYRLAASNISPLFDAARRARCVDVSGRPSSRPHSQAAERKAGQRRRALSCAAGAEPRTENRCLPIFEHGEHQPFDVPEHRGIPHHSPVHAGQSRPKPRGGSMLTRSSRSRSTMACKAVPVAVSRRLSGKTSYQAAYSACRATSPATVSCQRCARVRRSAGRR